MLYLITSPPLFHFFFVCSSFLPSYLEIIFLVDRKAVREDIASNNHVSLIPIHCEPVHPQKLRKQRVAMALNNKLQKECEEDKYMTLFSVTMDT